ncbi:helix-turn-helix transcriptional regulator [Kribbella sp. NPDC023855]|uniref:helix-turn-helix transcriptional regulator n=1 Tax=Kribbella sp. NPDC023855 TaxID=3154698 RepID=UPI0034058AA5
MGALCNYLLWLRSACPPSWQVQASETLHLLLRTFLTHPLPEQPPPLLPDPIVAMMREVADRWSAGPATAISLKDLATAAQVSPSTLTRIFRRHFSVGPVAAIELLRLSRAEPLLWQSNLSMHAIAVQCGFADGYHFSRRFRTTYAMAPTTFRQTPPESVPPSPIESYGLTTLQSLLPGETRTRSV